MVHMDDEFDYYGKMLHNSEAILEEQKKTNQELNRLRQQMAHANAMQQQMLQNQIREIEERETQKFYKLRSFKLNQLVTSIDGLTDINQKAFTYYFFKDAIMQNATDAQNNLNEISDKEYCNTIISKVRDIYKQIGDVNQLEIAEELKKFVTGGDEYNGLCDELESAKMSLKNMPPPPAEPQSRTITNSGQNAFGVILILFGAILTVGGIAMLGGNHTEQENGRIFLAIGISGIALGIVLSATSSKQTTVTEKDINEYKDALAKYNKVVDDWKAKISELETKIANCDYMKAMQYFFNTFTSWKTEIDNYYKQLSC